MAADAIAIIMLKLHPAVAVVIATIRLHPAVAVVQIIAVTIAAADFSL